MAFSTHGIILFSCVAVCLSAMVTYPKRQVDPSQGINPGYHRRELQQVIVYEHSNFRGEKGTYKGFGCINLLKYHQDRASSVFLRGNCLHLYDGESCTGEYVTLYETASSLTPMDFNDKVSSISAC